MIQCNFYIKFWLRLVLWQGLFIDDWMTSYWSGTFMATGYFLFQIKIISMIWSLWIRFRWSNKRITSGSGSLGQPFSTFRLIHRWQNKVLADQSDTAITWVNIKDEIKVTCEGEGRRPELWFRLVFHLHIMRRLTTELLSLCSTLGFIVVKQLEAHRWSRAQNHPQPAPPHHLRPSPTPTAQEWRKIGEHQFIELTPFLKCFLRRPHLKSIMSMNSVL